MRAALPLGKTTNISTFVISVNYTIAIAVIWTAEIFFRAGDSWTAVVFVWCAIIIIIAVRIYWTARIFFRTRDERTLVSIIRCSIIVRVDTCIFTINISTINATNCTTIIRSIDSRTSFIFF